MKKQRIILILPIISVFVFFIVYKFIFSKGNPDDENSNFPPTEIIQPVQAAESQSEKIKSKNDSKKTGYKIKDYQGKLAVFENGEKKPFRVTDIDVKDLPQEDQKQLGEGIDVSDGEHLRSILEDYLS